MIDVDATRVGEPEFTVRRNLREGDTVRITVNGVVEETWRIAAGHEWDLLVALSGTVRESP